MATLLFVGFASAEAWPLTSFHLFSHTRGRFVDERVVMLVDDVGTEIPLRFLDLPLEFHASELRLKHLDGESQAARDAACNEWIAALPRSASVVARALDTRFLRVYRVRRDLATEVSTAAELRLECGSQTP